MQSVSHTPSIYQIRHIASGRVYVGSATDPRDRLGLHVRNLTKGNHHSRYLQNAWNKYGESAFVFEIIEPVLFVEDLLAREQYWIDTLHACDPDRGFNIAPRAGSVLGTKRTEETRAKIKSAKTTPEHRAQLSAQAKERWADPEFRAKQLARMADPASRAKQSAGQRKWLAANPSARSEINARAQTPERSSALSARQTERWADPDYRARLVEGRSERAQALWNDPGFRAKRAALHEARRAGRRKKRGE